MARSFFSLLVLAVLGTGTPAAEPAKLNLLFLGDNAGHQPKTRFAILEPVLAKRGISMTYTDKLDDITLANLNKYDGLVIYANQAKGKPEHVKAILDYTASGKGFIPLHCASFCFTDDKDYIDLVGAQFRSHTTGTFRATNVKPEHPIMTGYGGFESWDETYVHHKHNDKDRTVLEVRTDGDLKEPWTWTRTHGKGRVFYTAWGHDSRTWSHAGFHNLVERGIRWACNQDPALAGGYADIAKMKPITGDKKDFEYVDAKIPFYPGRDGGPAPRQMQKPLSPEKSMTHYTVPEGFELKLFASEAMMQGGKPLAMTWDERGRLWVSITMDYPNEMQREGEGRDKIIILEDENGDGQADKVTVFAEKLSIPTSLLCVRGGVIVHQAPHTLFLKDTNGDDKADLREVLFTGWGTGDTHAGPSNLRYGFDNWIYGAVGYSGFNGTVAGERFSFRQGFYRFKLNDKLKVEKLEFLRSTSNNTWGFCFNEYGEMFGSTANGCVLVHLAIPNRYYEKVKGLTGGVLPPVAVDNRMYPVTNKVRQVDWHGGFTAASHAAIYTARTYPQEYWNRTAFVSEPTGHLTATFVLQPNGTEYVARNSWNLAASQDEWAAPIDAQVGPDGHVWINDWYNYIVQHNPTPAGFRNGRGNAYETELRDKKHGRIYRVVYTGAKAEKTPNLKDAKPDLLVETLKHSNLLWRQAAQRLLVERGNADVVPALTALVKDAKAPETAVVQALWTLSHFVRVPETSRAIAVAGLGHSSVAVRRATLQALAPSFGKAADGIFEDKLFVDADPQMRLAAALALVDLPKGTHLPKVLASYLAQPGYLDDKNIADAVTMAGSSHPLMFLSGAVKLPKDKTLAPNVLRVIERVAQALSTLPAIAPDPVPAPVGTPDQTLPHPLETLLEAMGQNPAVDDAILSGLALGWPAGKTLALSPNGEKVLANLIAKSPATSRGRLLKLAATWGVKGIEAQLAEVTKGLLTVALDAKAKDDTRLDAIKQVAEFLGDDDKTVTQLLDAIVPGTSPELSVGILNALAGSKSKVLGAGLVAKVTALAPSARPAALRLILGRPESTRAYLDAVEKGTLRFDMLALDQKAALATHPDKTIAERAKKILALGGGLPDPNRQKVIEELKFVLEKSGDVANGKKMFTAHCAKCHKHGSEGAQIGPDLTGFAVHPKEEIFIHVLDPSRSVEGNYKAYTAKTLDGRVITGLLSSESKTSVELLDAENKRHAIGRDNLDELKESKLSLMPEGFEKQLKPVELTDLLEFMTQKGKYVPIPLDKVASVVSTKDMFFDAGGTAERLIFPDWKPKEFAGVPFHLVDPQGEKIKNVILFNGPQGKVPPTMPKAVTLPCNTPAKAIHFLSGIGGWNATSPRSNGPVSLIVRLQYADGKTEDHELRDGVHFADYIRKVDVPGSKFAFNVRGQQVRYLSVEPKRKESIKTIELVKGTDRSAPIVVAVTVETP